MSSRGLKSGLRRLLGRQILIDLSKFYFQEIKQGRLIPSDDHGMNVQLLSKTELSKSVSAPYENGQVKSFIKELSSSAFDQANLNDFTEKVIQEASSFHHGTHDASHIIGSYAPSFAQHHLQQFTGLDSTSSGEELDKSITHVQKRRLHRRWLQWAYDIRDIVVNGSGIYSSYSKAQKDGKLLEGALEYGDRFFHTLMGIKFKSIIIFCAVAAVASFFVNLLFGYVQASKLSEEEDNDKY